LLIIFVWLCSYIEISIRKRFKQISGKQLMHVFYFITNTPDRLNTLNITVWLSVNKTFIKYVSNMTSVTFVTGTVYHSGATTFIPFFFFVGFALLNLLFVPLSFYLWPLSVVLRYSIYCLCLCPFIFGHCLSFYVTQSIVCAFVLLSLAIVCRSTSFMFWLPRWYLLTSLNTM